MDAKLYMLEISHPAQAVRAMLELKGIPTKLVNLDLIAGLHDVRLRAAGFPGGTIPSLAIGGRKVTGSLACSRAIDELVPDPPLFGTTPQERAAIEAAEAWGEAVIQPLPRSIMRAALVASPVGREWFVRYQGLPGALAPATLPILRRVAKQARTSPRWAQGAIAALPGHMRQVESLIDQGIIGGPQPNAADFQIASGLRFLLTIEDLRPIIDDRPAADLARRHFPDYFGPIDPGIIPEAWLRQPVAA